MEIYNSFHWNNLYDTIHINGKVILLNKYINDINDKNIPFKEIRIRYSKPKWFDKELEDAINLRLFSYNIYRKNKTIENRNNVKNNIININKSKELQNRKLLSAKFDSSKPAILWRQARKLGLVDNCSSTSSPFTMGK